MKIYQTLNFYFRFLLTLPIRIYQLSISPFLGQRCKYFPSCSSYAIQSIMNRGVLGFIFIGWRLLRCNPWSHGGVDYAPNPLKNNGFRANYKFLNQERIGVR